MTDITDQDRRDAREWAEDVAETFKYDDEVPRETRAAVNYILATVDAPAPTLAEELRSIREWVDWEAFSVFDEIVARAEQIEQERDEARAEVERLTAERDDATVAREENVAADQQANTQETLSGSLPDPADVPVGQAWLVSCGGGEPVPGFRRGDGEKLPWVMADDDTVAYTSDNNIRLVSRLVTAPRQITTREELDALPRRTVIRDKDGVVCERTSLGEGWYSPESTTDQTHYITFPATVLYTPEVEA